MMVGEIRDGENGGHRRPGSQHGHLVFSTLHTNDSAGALTRLVNLGVEPYLVASAVIASSPSASSGSSAPTAKRPTRPTDTQLSELVSIGPT
jgi:general secretion pathway protein E